MMQAPFLGFGGGKAALDVSKLFATSLYTGTGAAQTITNGIDLAGKGGLVWGKSRQFADDNFLIDTVRGKSTAFYSDSTAAEHANSGNDITAFNSNGFSTGSGFDLRPTAGALSVFWAFAQDPRFFKIITYTGTGSAMSVPHGLDPSVSVGMAVVKRRNSTGPWVVWHRGATPGNHLFLNTTAAQVSTQQQFYFGNDTAYKDPDHTNVYIGGSADTNTPGGLYEMLVFAHDTASDGVVQCISFAPNSTFTLGWRPQFLLGKAADIANDWCILDTARGWGAGTDVCLRANTTAAEATFDFGEPTSTGFTVTTGFSGSATNIVGVAIRAPGG